MATVHAFEFLDTPASPIAGPLIVLFGNDRYLKTLVRGALLERIASPDAEFDVTVFEGATAAWRDVADTLRTSSLFQRDGKRVALIDDADAFATKHRSQLEELAAGKEGDSILVLLVESWAANTRLYKALDKAGLQVHCGEPQSRSGSSKSRDSTALVKWIVRRADQVHGLSITQGLARQLMEIVDWNTGRADQELAKLALFGNKTDEATLLAVCGGWKIQSVWDAAMSASQGKTGEALEHLSNLFQSGEHPLALFGPLAWSLRRFGRLGELAARQTRAGKRTDFSASLARAGFRNFGGEMSAADSAANQLSSARVALFYRWLLETDLALKGTHSEESRGRLALEKLFFRMGAKVGAKVGASIPACPKG